LAIDQGLEKTALSTIDRYRMLEGARTVVAAVSGGPDSVALLMFLHGLAPRVRFDLHVFHLDHMLRGQESARDARFVEELALELGLPVRSLAVDVRAGLAGRSPQDAAREIRLDRLLGFADEVSADRIATGHTADDQVETFLMRAIQGAGLSGLGGIPPALAGSILILAFAAVHAAEVRRGAQVQNAAVLLKVTLIVVFVAIAACKIGLPAAQPDSPFPVAAFGVSLIWISFSYSGWNAAVYVGSEVRDPEKTIPRSLLLGTALVTLLYLALNTVFVFAAPVAELAGKLDVGRIAARAIGGAFFEEAVAGLIALALVSSVSSLVMAGPRVYAQMAADGFLPGGLAVTSGPPRMAIALQAGLALLFLWSATFDALLTWIGFTLSISTAATVAALIVLRKREGKTLAVPGYPVVPWLFLAGVLAMTAFTVVQRPMESLVGFATIAAGFAAWRLQQRKATSRKPQA